jgi:sorbose reductase
MTLHDLFSLQHQTAVITGAARGLGLTFATTLAAAGANIAAIDILGAPSSSLHGLASQHGVKVKYYQCDITSLTQINDTMLQIESDFRSINININAAGVVTDEPFVATTEANIDRTFNVNVKGSFLVAQACAASMIKHSNTNAASSTTHTSNKSIIFIASISTHTPSSAQNISAYIASKAAVRGLVKPLAVELAPHGIRVNSLSPGYTMTDMMRSLQQQQPDLVDGFARESMFGRIGQPDDLAGPMLMLCSPAGGWMTGQDILIDGGAASWKGMCRSVNER